MKIISRTKSPVLYWALSFLKARLLPYFVRKVWDGFTQQFANEVGLNYDIDFKLDI